MALRQLAPDLWVADRPQRFLGLEIGTRMTVVRLADGRLFVHSPVALAPPTRAALDGLGIVKAVVAPNRYHHLYVGEYIAAYPDARVYGAPGLAEKRRDLRFHGTLTDDAPPEWAGELDQLVFRAVPAFNEVVFCHRRSRTLIATDLAFNVRRASSWTVRLLLTLDGAYGTFGLGWVEKLLVRDRPGARAAVDRMLAWDFDRIIVAHGDVLDTGAKEGLRAAFAWL